MPRDRCAGASALGLCFQEVAHPSVLGKVEPTRRLRRRNTCSRRQLSESQSTRIADYIVQRIAVEGITHCFGVAGDYLFPICNVLERSPKVKGISCANELTAAYAAEGTAARIRGTSMVCVADHFGRVARQDGS
jgi:Thiamine pyrophosphate enzyme, N-terminal TPP binding domain